MELQPGALSHEFILEKHGNKARIFSVVPGKQELRDASETLLHTYEPFVSAAPEGPSLWRLNLLNFDPVEMQQDPETGEWFAKVGLANSELDLIGLPPKWVVDLLDNMGD